MPALELAQETGKLIRWLKREGEAVAKGEPIMEIETDKVTVEIEAMASGTLAGIRADEGDVIPVGRTIAWILAPGESVPSVQSVPESVSMATVSASPLARRIAEEHGIDIARVKPDGGRVEKADVLALPSHLPPPPPPPPPPRRAGGGRGGGGGGGGGGGEDAGLPQSAATGDRVRPRPGDAARLRPRRRSVGGRCPHHSSLSSFGSCPCPACSAVGRNRVSRHDLARHGRAHDQ